MCTLPELLAVPQNYVNTESFCFTVGDGGDNYGKAQTASASFLVLPLTKNFNVATTITVGA
jgi:hypothetical protein